jgi:Nucleotidyltransferase of unknown function (DUF6036)
LPLTRHSLERQRTCTAPGGFVVSVLYGLSRSTNDLDLITVESFALITPLLQLGGPESALAKEHGVHIDAKARVATIPCNYAERLTEMYPGALSGIRLLAPEPHDLVLSKLERNADRDIEDVKMLALSGALNPETLRERYIDELRPYLGGRIEWHDQTLDLWVEMINELAANRR